MLSTSVYSVTRSFAWLTASWYPYEDDPHSLSWHIRLQYTVHCSEPFAKLVYLRNQLKSSALSLRFFLFILKVPFFAWLSGLRGKVKTTADDPYDFRILYRMDRSAFDRYYENFHQFLSLKSEKELCGFFIKDENAVVIWW